MRKLFVLVGESGSGKSTLAFAMEERFPKDYRRVVTCTSREKRVGEMDGRDYHFLPKDYFINNPDLILVKETSEGLFYGTRISELQSTEKHLLLTSKPSGVARLVRHGIGNIVVVDIQISDDLKTYRMRLRGDTEEMIQSRLVSDAKGRALVDLGSTPVIKLNAEQSVDEWVDQILRHVDG